MDKIKEFFYKYTYNDQGDPNLLGKLIVIVVTIILAKILIAIINKLFSDRVLKKIPKYTTDRKYSTLGHIFHNALKILIYFIATTIVLEYLGVNTSSIIAVAGVGGIAIAFAAQSLIKDIIQGAFILFEDQINIGDYVKIGSSSGTVVDMGMRVTTLKDIDGAIHIIPNGTIDVVVNHSKNPMRAAVEVKVAHDTKYEDAVAAIKTAVSSAYEEADYFVTQPEIVGIMGIDDFNYRILVQAMTKQGSQWAGQRAFRKKIIEQLQARGISHTVMEVKDAKLSS